MLEIKVEGAEVQFSSKGSMIDLIEDTKKILGAIYRPIETRGTREVPLDETDVLKAKVLWKKKIGSLVATIDEDIKSQQVTMSQTESVMPRRVYEGKLDDFFREKE